jgi:trk system potassium uptake protein TrkA
VVARVNHPKNEWLFDAGWGVDVAVSTPRLLTALVEEAVSVGDLVRLLSFQQGNASLVEVTLPPDSSLAGQLIGDIDLPAGSAIVAVLREGRLVLPTPETALEGGDEVLALSTDAELEPQLATVLGEATAESPVPN